MIDGLEQLQSDVEQLRAAMEAEFPDGAMGELEIAAAQVLQLLATYAAEYPPALADSWYRRTGTLGRLWMAATPHIAVSGHVLDARIANATPYGPYVQDPDQQAPQHRGRWKTTDQIVQEHVEEISPLLAQAGYRIVERVAEAV